MKLRSKVPAHLYLIVQALLLSSASIACAADATIPDSVSDDRPRCGHNTYTHIFTERSSFFEFEHVNGVSDQDLAKNSYFSSVSPAFAEVEVTTCDEELYMLAGTYGTNSICPASCPVLERYSCTMIPANPAKRTMDYIAVSCEVYHPSSPDSRGVARCQIKIDFDIDYYCVHPSVAVNRTRVDRNLLEDR